VSTDGPDVVPENVCLCRHQSLHILLAPDLVVLSSKTNRCITVSGNVAAVDRTILQQKLACFENSKVFDRLSDSHEEVFVVVLAFVEQGIISRAWFAIKEFHSHT